MDTGQALATGQRILRLLGSQDMLCAATECLYSASQKAPCTAAVEHTGSEGFAGMRLKAAQYTVLSSQIVVRLVAKGGTIAAPCMT